MMAGMGLLYIIFLLVGAAAVKYLFFAKGASSGAR